MASTDPIYEAAKKIVSEKLAGKTLDQLSPIVLEIVQNELKKPGAATKHVLEEVCHGAMSAVVLEGLDVPAGAVEVLRGLTHILAERSGDPMRTMGYALDGIARIGDAVSSPVLSDIGSHIETEFMGAGEQFHSLAAKYHK